MTRPLSALLIVQAIASLIWLFLFGVMIVKDGGFFTWMWAGLPLYIMAWRWVEFEMRRSR